MSIVGSGDSQLEILQMQEDVQCAGQPKRMTNVPFTDTPYPGEDAEEQEHWGGAVVGTTDVESVLVIAPT